MLHADKLTINVDYRDYKPPEDLPKGRLVETHGVQMHMVGEGKTVIVPRSYDAYACDPFEQLRDSVLAAALGARVIGIDLPGVGLNRSSQSTPEQRTEAKRGSLASRSEVMIEAFGLENEKLDFIGYSMGAWAVAELVQSPAFRDRGLQIGAISLVEPVNDQDWQINTVHKVMLGEFGHDKRYKQETKVHFPELPAPALPENGLPLKRIKPLTENARLIKGMWRGFTPSLARAVRKDTLNHATGLSKAPFTIYRANGSYATRPEAVRATLEALHEGGQHNLRFVEFSPKPDNDPYDPHQHLFWHSMGAVAMLAAHIGSERG